MANVNGGKKIKGNVIGKSEPIKANVASKNGTIKANVTNIPSASEEHKGLIRIATEKEAIIGEDKLVAITPYTLKKATHYIHEQGIASNTWVIEHNLNKKPSVTVVDTAGTVFTASVEYNSDNVCTVYVNGATKGKAYLN